MVTIPTSAHTPRWAAFLAVCVTYVATTTGEALLAPIFPIAAGELGIDVNLAGVLFATLAIGISAANVAGGLLLRWWTADRVLLLAVITSAIGAAISSAANGVTVFVVGQLALGAGAGLLYPAAIMAVGAFAGPERRGFAMGLFGVSFSLGLTLAAGLASVGVRLDWRWSFAVVAAFAAASALGVIRLSDAPRSEQSAPMFAGLRAVLGTPTIVGVTGGMSQYATVSFLPVFAVAVWGIGEARAALILAVGRIASIPAKLITGWLTDRLGSTTAARVTGATLGVAGAIWALSPSMIAGIVAACLFTATVSGLFPIANTMALERVGRSGASLGVFRSVQIAAGALMGVVIASFNGVVGLRATIAIVGSLPILLVLLNVGRDAQTGSTAA